MPKLENETESWCQEDRICPETFARGNWIGFVNEQPLPRTFKTVLGFVVYAQALLFHFKNIELHVAYIGPADPAPIATTINNALYLFQVCPCCGFWSNKFEAQDPHGVDFMFTEIAPLPNIVLYPDKSEDPYVFNYYVPIQSFICAFCDFEARKSFLRASIDSRTPNGMHWETQLIRPEPESHYVPNKRIGVPMRVKHPAINLVWLDRVRSTYYGYTGNRITP